MAKRLNVNLADDVADALEKIAKHYGVSVTEAVRKAISTEFFLLNEINSGNKVLLSDAADKERLREVVFR